jgi:hypothetical protein
MTTGVLYVTDESYLAEAARSAASVARHAPDLAIGVATDAASVPEVFDRYLPIEIDGWDWDLRIRALRESPFDRTLYLDTDTYVTGDVSGVFDLLDAFDVAAAHAPVRRVADPPETDRPTPPDSFPEYNCGVLLYDDSGAVDDLLSTWEDRYLAYSETMPDVHDQPAFRDAVYDSDVRIATLPPEYNCRLPFHGYAGDEVRVVHGAADNVEHVADRLNARSGPRSFRCVSVGRSWDVVFCPGRVKTALAKAGLVVREKSASDVVAWAREKL